MEVGLRRGDDWSSLDEPVDIEAVAIDHDGEPVAGQTIVARVFREGWHSWWEWSESSHSYAGGEYQMRRDQRERAVHECRVTSAEEPVHCTFSPARSGTYRVEVSVTDEAGRVASAGRRLYVAGPDEHPDRDPPGAPIAVTPTRGTWTVGETAELAFESPWASESGATALITVEREGVMSVERRALEAGGQVVRVPITDAMVPNVYVGVTLVRPRVGPPDEDVDLNAPDLRFGIAQLQVRPEADDLAVTLELEPSARPGEDVPVAVMVRDARGRPVRGEVALWAVDEGTLRMTGYTVPEPLSGLFVGHPAGFAWEDIRRDLVSRIARPPLPEASGDGGGENETRRMVDDRESFDPTPLWLPHLVTDEDGRAQATITLPPRPTEYRVMAVAIDEAARGGEASAQLVAEQPIVVRPAFPSFVMTGDRIEVAAFVHNATEEPLDVRWWATVGGSEQARHTVSIPPGGEARVAETITGPDEGPLEIQFDAEAAGESVAVRDEVTVMPRGRFVRSQVFTAAEGSGELSVGLPAGTPNMGHVTVTVASHPFIGFEGALDSLLASRWHEVESTSATIIALGAYADLEIADTMHGYSERELNAIGRRETRRLVDLQSVDGGFERWSSRRYPLPWESTVGDPRARGGARARVARRRGAVHARARLPRAVGHWSVVRQSIRRERPRPARLRAAGAPRRRGLGLRAREHPRRAARFA